MITYPYRIAGDAVAVHVPQGSADLGEFRRWFSSAAARGPVALDTETTGLDIYAPHYRLRTVQFGDTHTAWVLPFERGGSFAQTARSALRQGEAKFQIHNAPFDWCVIDKHAGVPIEDLAPRTIDTRLKAGLVDPRQPQEGGRGTALKPLAAWYIDPASPDTQGDLTKVFRSLGLTKETGWAGIPLDHPTYNLYAGLDVLLTARLDIALNAELDMLSVRPRLIAYEHEIARICALMQRRGMILDVDYVSTLRDTLTAEEAEFSAVAAAHGVDSVTSNAQIIAALQGMGETLTTLTKSKKSLAVDGPVLQGLADVDAKWRRLGIREPNPLANAVLRAKRAGKWRSAYADTFLATADSEGRIHPFINSMQARTGRMSITRPALQTLPSKDWMIRRALLAEPGEVFVSCDFQAVEMRVLAALANVQGMRDGFNSGLDADPELYPNGFDIHMYTARLIKGAGATAEDRGTFKAAGLSKIYGGGVATTARQTGASEAEISRAFAEYDRVFPEIKRQSGRWQREARQTGMVHLSVTGRRLPLDRQRAYAVVNYACQSAARDVLGQSLINLEEAGLLDTLRLPIHDEVLASVPAAEAADYAKAIQDCMSFDLFGVPITSEADIGGRSWGSLYGADM